MVYHCRAGILCRLHHLRPRLHHLRPRLHHLWAWLHHCGPGCIICGPGCIICGPGCIICGPGCIICGPGVICGPGGIRGPGGIITGPGCIICDLGCIIVAPAASSAVSAASSVAPAASSMAPAASSAAPAASSGWMALQGLLCNPWALHCLYTLTTASTVQLCCSLVEVFPILAICCSMKPPVAQLENSVECKLRNALARASVLRVCVMMLARRLLPGVRLHRGAAAPGGLLHGPGGGLQPTLLFRRGGDTRGSRGCAPPPPPPLVVVQRGRRPHRAQVGHARAVEEDLHLAPRVEQLREARAKLRVLVDRIAEQVLDLERNSSRNCPPTFLRIESNIPLGSCEVGCACRMASATTFTSGAERCWFSSATIVSVDLRRTFSVSLPRSR